MAQTQVCTFDPVTKLVNAVVAVDGSLVPSAGAASAGLPVVLNPDGILDPTLTDLGTQATAGMNLNAGNLVSLYNVLGVLTMQQATADSLGNGSSGPGPFPALASGFVADDVLIGNVGTIYLTGLMRYIDPNSEFDSTSIGAQVFLSAVTLGGITLTPPGGGGDAEQSIGYVIGYDLSSQTVTVNFVAGFQDFSHISGVNPITKGGTGATSAPQALDNLFGTFTVAQVWIGPISGAPAFATARTLVNTDLATAVFGASGASHQPGAVPDPGATAGIVRFLREDSGFAIPPVFGPSGAGHAVGYVPDPGATAGTTRFLREDGSWIIVSTTINSDNPGQTANLGPITLLTPLVDGTYRVAVYEDCEVVGAAGGGTNYGDGVYGSGPFGGPANDSVQTAVSWQDPTGQVRYATPIATPLDLSARNADSGSVVIRAVAGQPITFEALLAAMGTPTYDVFVALERL